MNSLNYSPLAVNVLPQFDRSVSTIRILVEGPDDVPFWTNLFESLLPKNSKYKILCEPKQGCYEVCKSIKKDNHSQKIICALDSEYDEIIHNKEKDKNFYTIYTIRHSIENFLFCPISFCQLVKKLNLDYTTDISSDCENFINELCEKLEILLYLDCKKQLYPNLFPKGIKILGSNANVAVFTEKKCYIPNAEKIKKFIKDNNLNNILVDDIKRKFKEKNLYHYLNGHFITFSVYAFLSSKIKRKHLQIGKTNLYAYLYDYCSNCKSKCSDYIKIEEHARQILDSVVKKQNK